MASFSSSFCTLFFQIHGLHGTTQHSFCILFCSCVYLFGREMENRNKWEEGSPIFPYSCNSPSKARVMPGDDASVKVYHGTGSDSSTWFCPSFPMCISSELQCKLNIYNLIQHSNTGFGIANGILTHYTIMSISYLFTYAKLSEIQSHIFYILWIGHSDELNLPSWTKQNKTKQKHGDICLKEPQERINYQYPKKEREK